MSKVHGARCDQCGQHCVPGDGRTWITIKDGPVKVTRHVRGDRKSNVGFGRLDFCSIGCLVSYINDLQAGMSPATRNIEIVRCQAVLTEPISEPETPRLWADALETPLKTGQKIRAYPGGHDPGYLCEVAREPSLARLAIKLLESSDPDNPVGTILEIDPCMYQIELVNGEQDGKA